MGSPAIGAIIRMSLIVRDLYNVSFDVVHGCMCTVCHFVLCLILPAASCRNICVVYLAENQAKCSIIQKKEK